MENELRAYVLVFFLLSANGPSVAFAGGTRIGPGKVKPPTKAKFENPVTGYIVGFFGNDFSIFSKGKSNSGIDVENKAGTYVKAAESGRFTAVPASSQDDVSCVRVSHEGDLATRYCGMKPDSNLVEGAKVRKGQTIGELDGSLRGVDRSYAVLHFEVEEKGVAVDPAPFLSPPLSWHSKFGP